MLGVLLSAVGWIVVVVTVVDVFRTVLWSGQGAGPVTSILTDLARRTLPRLAGGNRRAHSLIGPLTLLAIVGAWSGLLLIGFTLVLEVDADAIRTASTDRPSDWFERAYYVGFTLFTLGLGDLRPATDAMRAVTVLMNAFGMFLITLSVTYLLPVISASVGSRSFASSVSALGETPSEILVESWDGQRVQLEHQLRELASELSVLADQHLAYPVLHLFHAAEPSASAPRAVARLDDVLTLLDAVEDGAAPPRPGRRQLRSSIERYVRTYGKPVAGHAEPPPLTPGQLADAGIPLRVDGSGFDQLLRGRDEHRRRVHDLASGDH